MIHMWHPWQLSNFQDPPPPLTICIQNSSNPLTLDVRFQTKQPPPPPPLAPFQNDNQSLKKSIIQGWLSFVITSFFQVGFRFQYQLINLVWLPFDFFSFNWGLTICFFVTLYSWVCSWPKISRNVFHLELLTFLVLILQSTCFICKTRTMENINYRTTTKSKVHVNERNQNKNQVMRHSNWPRRLLFDSAHKQCNGIIKRWFHFLTLESKGRFLVNNILFGSAWCLVTG